ncbi:MAG: VWA domain-containing protein [Labilithrix sp.]|nr:VWA domain-containing protein [Labilithrix sp.]MCW5815992.1 VWA domain-containing protein [Labilithrix sp.]
MRKSFFLAPLFAAALAIACSSQPRESFYQDKAPTEPDAGRGMGFQPDDEPGTDGEDGGCSQSQTEIARTPVVIEFVVDDSGSMDFDGGGKWEAARDALLAAFDDMSTNADPATFVGSMRFGTSIRNKIAPKPMSDSSHVDELKDAIDTPTAGGGGTESVRALTEAYKIVNKFKPPASAGLDSSKIKRVVVFMSDGEPNGGATAKKQCEELAAEQLAEQPPAGPVTTFSVGIGPFPTGSSYDPIFMSKVAQAGGTAPAGCDPEATDPSAVCHFQITPGDDVTAMKQALIDAINKIRALSASCEFSFKVSSNVDLNRVTVTMTSADGSVTAIPKDAENGWTFDDPKKPTKVILHGNACSVSNGTVSGRVDVTLACKGVL